jgi:hypothetical protein
MKSKRWQAITTIFINQLHVLKSPSNNYNSIVYQIERRLGKIRKHTRETQRNIFGKIDDGIFIRPNQKSVDVKSLEKFSTEVRAIKNEEARIRGALERIPANMDKKILGNELTKLQSEADLCYAKMKEIIGKLEML